MWWQHQQGREGKCEGVKVGWPDLGSRSSSVGVCIMSEMWEPHGCSKDVVLHLSLSAFKEHVDCFQYLGDKDTQRKQYKQCSTCIQHISLIKVS